MSRPRDREPAIPPGPLAPPGAPGPAPSDTERLRVLLDHAADAFFLHDAAGVILDVNQQACRSLGYGRDELLAKLVWEVEVGVPRDELLRLWAERPPALGEGVTIAGRHRRRDGSVFPVEVHLRGFAAQGRHLFLALVRDVSARHSAEQALRASEERYRSFIAHSSEAIYRFEFVPPVPADRPPLEQARLCCERAVFAECNDACAASYGFPRAEDLIGRRYADVVPSAPPQLLEFLAEMVRRGYRIDNAEAEETDVHGRPRYTLNSCHGVVEDGAVVRVWGTHRDITDMRLAEEARRQSEEHFRVVFERAQLGIVLVDARGVILRANPAFARMFGWRVDELVGTSVLDITHQDDHEITRQTIRDLADSGVDRVSVQKRYRRRDGSVMWGQLLVSAVRDEHGALRHSISILDDITEKKRLEEQLLHAQRMEAVGRLAGGIAHDFNNLLTVILGQLEEASAALAPGSIVGQSLEPIRQAAERAAQLTRQLLAFARRQIVEPKVVSVNAVVRGTTQLLHRLLGEDIDIALELAPDVHPVRIDPSQLEQVIVNLAVNARDAMPRGGALTLTTRAFQDPGRAGAGSPGRPAAPALVPGQEDWVCLEVRDTGAGIADEVRPHLFEPFFTTKEAGKGTGLGLATVHGIVNQAGGCIAVDSVAGRGAAFSVYLPACAASAVPDSGASRPRPRGGTETILLVEDEGPVRDVARQSLSALGYRVLEAGSPAAALAIAAEHRTRIDLLVTDVVLPQMNGRELAERLVAQRPGLRVLYVSGYTNDALVERGLSRADAAFLANLYTGRTLAVKVREVLDAVAQG